MNDLGNINIIRQKPRTLICIPMLYSVENKNSYVIDYCTDLSEGGVLIQTETPIVTGIRLNIKFRLPNAIKLIDVIGEVVWSHKHIPGQDALKLIPGMGVKFLNLDPLGKRYIETFVNKERTKGGTEGDLII